MSDSTSQSKRADASRNAPVTPGAGGQSHPWVWGLVFLAILAVAGVLYGRHRGAAPAAGPAAGAHGRGGPGMGPIMVSTATAHPGSLGIYINGLGYVTSLSTVSVNSRVAGQIMKVYYQEGQLVQAGDPLLDIDPRPNQAALTQAQGQLARDQAMLEDARLDLERYQQAFASNAIPKQQLDTQVAVVHQDEGTVQLDQGLLDNAKVQLAYCHITAPTAGRVGLRLVDAGNIVQAGSSNLVVITQVQPISVVFSVRENDLPRIQAQMRQGRQLVVEALDADQQNKLATGTLVTVDNQIDSSSGTFKCRALFVNADESLYPNQFVNAHLLVDTLTGATLLPNTAIQRSAADSAFVYLLDPADTNELKTITLQTITVKATDDTVSAVEGIAPGQTVVADNFNKLTDGTKVIVRKAAEGTNKPGDHKKPRKEPQ